MPDSHSDRNANEEEPSSERAASPRFPRGRRLPSARIGRRPIGELYRRQPSSRIHGSGSARGNQLAGSSRRISITERYEGPFPHPRYLQILHEVGGQDLMKVPVDMALKEQQHSHDMQRAELALRKEALDCANQVSQRQHKEAESGSRFGFIIAIFAIAAAVYLVAVHADKIVSSILVGTTLGSLVSVFVRSKRKPETETIRIDPLPHAAAEKTHISPNDEHLKNSKPASG